MQPSELKKKLMISRVETNRDFLKTHTAHVYLCIITYNIIYHTE